MAAFLAPSNLAALWRCLMLSGSEYELLFALLGIELAGRSERLRHAAWQLLMPLLFLMLLQLLLLELCLWLRLHITVRRRALI